MNFLNNINFLKLELNFSHILEYARIVIIVFDFLLIIATVYIFREALKLRPKFKADPNSKPIMTLRKEVLLEKWSGIQSKFAEGRPDSMKVAIIQGDSLIDSILKSAGLEGEHMADRLDNIKPGEFQSFEDVWVSHKIRNQVVHEENYQLTHSAAEKALKGYEKFLREIKVLPS